MGSTRVIVTTDFGPFELALDDDEAPKTVANFLAYVDANHYAGTLFHRVIPGFMAQGGGYGVTYDKKPVRAPVENEARPERKNLRGTVAMARTGEPHSATAQFFVNVADNGFLDQRDRSAANFGYAVFGRVVSGMEVVDAIVAVKTGSRGPFSKDAPLDPVVIRDVKRA